MKWQRLTPPSLLLAVILAAAPAHAQKQTGPSQDEVRDQVTAWFNNLTVDLMVGEINAEKSKPSEAAELVQVRAKDTQADAKAATVLCDLDFKMKVSYEGGRDKTPIRLLEAGIGFENSLAKTGEIKTLPVKFIFEKRETRWELRGPDAYRRLRPDDNLQCGARVKEMASSFGGGPPSGELAAFECLDKNGKTVEIELATTTLTDGKIQTKRFGTILMKSFGLRAEYYMTESQIRNIKKSLGW